MCVCVCVCVCAGVASPRPTSECSGRVGERGSDGAECVLCVPSLCSNDMSGMKALVDEGFEILAFPCSQFGNQVGKHRLTHTDARRRASPLI